MNRFFYRIWFIGAGVWFFDAVLSMHHRFLARGLAQAVLAAAFLVLGLLFRQRYRTEQRRKQRRDADQQRPGNNGEN